LILKNWHILCVFSDQVQGGQCWQVEPNPDGKNHNNPMETLLGGDGGKFETVVSAACTTTIHGYCTRGSLSLLYNKYLDTDR